MERNKEAEGQQEGTKRRREEPDVRRLTH